jgi:hypothetical protein
MEFKPSQIIKVNYDEPNIEGKKKLNLKKQGSIKAT